MSRTRYQLGYLLARRAFRALCRRWITQGNGGVSLGLNGIVIKSQRHRRRGFACGRPRLREVRQDLLAKIGRPRATSAAVPRRQGGIVTMVRSWCWAAELPADQVLATPSLSRMVDTSDEWITQRTGIRERRIAAEGETTSDMALAAARAALAAVGVPAQSIDLIVLATSTPDNTFPASAVSVQAGLGITHGAAFDLQAVCSGFVFGLATIDGLLRTGAFKRALVIGSETFSRILDWKDRTTCVLFGDGAGAVVVEAQREAGTREDRGILTTHLRSDGATSPSSMSTAARPRPRPSGICAWKAARCSSTRWS
jgi:3-oxoacyl-[acyl-carrier-protein] synthase III